MHLFRIDSGRSETRVEENKNKLGTKRDRPKEAKQYLSDQLIKSLFFFCFKKNETICWISIWFEEIWFDLKKFFVERT